jgi:hypothetical protein
MELILNQLKISLGQLRNTALTKTTRASEFMKFTDGESGGQKLNRRNVDHLIL